MGRQSKQPLELIILKSRFLRFCGLFILLLLTAVASLSVSPYFLPWMVDRFLVPRVLAPLGMELENVEGTVWGTIRVDGFNWTREDLVIRVPRMEIEPDLKAILAGDPAHAFIKQAYLLSPSVHLESGAGEDPGETLLASLPLGGEGRRNLRGWLPENLWIQNFDLRFRYGQQALNFSGGTLRGGSDGFGTFSVREISASFLPGLQGPAHALAAWRRPVLTLEGFKSGQLHNLMLRVQLGDINRQRVSTEYTLEGFGGSARGDLGVGLVAGKAGYFFAGSMEQISLDELGKWLEPDAEWGGVIEEGGLKYEGTLSNPDTANIGIRLIGKQIQGHGRGIDSVRLQAEAHAGRIRIHRFALQQSNNAISLEGNALLPGSPEEWRNPQFRLSVDADLPTLDLFTSLFAGWLPAVSGSLMAEGTFSRQAGKMEGTLALETSGLTWMDNRLPQMSAEMELEGTTIRFSDFKLRDGEDRFEAKLELRLENPIRYSGSLDGEITRWSQYQSLIPGQWSESFHATKLQLRWTGDGSLSAHSGTFEVLAEGAELSTPHWKFPQKLRIETKGSYSPEQILFRQLHLSGEGIDLQTSLLLAQDHVNIGNLRLEGPGETRLRGDATLPLKGLNSFLSPGDEPEFVPEGVIEGWVWARKVHSDFLGAWRTKSLAWEGNGGADFRWSGTLSEPNFEGRLLMEDFLVKQPKFPDQPGLLKAELSQHKGLPLRVKLEASWKPNIKLLVEGPLANRIAHPWPEKVWQSFGDESVTLNTSRFPLAWIGKAFGQVAGIELAGSISHQLIVTGSVLAPRFEGDVELHQVGLKSTLNDLQPINLDGKLRLESETFVIQDALTMDLLAGKAKVSGTGAVPWFKDAVNALEWTLDAVEFTTNSGLQLKANAKMQVNGPALEPQLGGDLTLLEAKWPVGLEATASSDPAQTDWSLSLPLSFELDFLPNASLDLNVQPPALLAPVFPEGIDVESARVQGTGKNPVLTLSPKIPELEEVQDIPIPEAEPELDGIPEPGPISP